MGTRKLARAAGVRSLDQSTLVSLYGKDVICITFTVTNMIRAPAILWLCILLAPLLISS